MSSLSVYYFFVREYISENGAYLRDDRYVNVAKLGLLTKEDAERVFQEALRSFIEVIDSNVARDKYTILKDNTYIMDILRSRRIILDLDNRACKQPTLTKHREYVLISESEAGDLPILEWEAKSESFSRLHYEDSLKELDNTGFIATTRLANLKPGKRANQDGKETNSSITLKEAATMSGFSMTTLKIAKKILDSKHAGIIAAVESGKISVDLASKLIVRGTFKSCQFAMLYWPPDDAEAYRLRPFRPAPLFFGANRSYPAGNGNADSDAVP